MLRSIFLVLLGAAALASLTSSANAATAHNSQAGAYGPNTHTCAPTPYFQTGGCFSAAVEDDRRYPFTVPAAPSRPGRQIGGSGGPLPFPDE